MTKINGHSGHIGVSWWYTGKCWHVAASALGHSSHSSDVETEEEAKKEALRLLKLAAEDVMKN